MSNTKWVKIGQREIVTVRLDQIASFYTPIYNGHQQYLEVTLLNGQKIRGEVTPETLSQFLKDLTDIGE